MAFGISRADDVVGTDGNGNAFFMRDATVQTFIPPAEGLPRRPLGLTTTATS